MEIGLKPALLQDAHCDALESLIDCYDHLDTCYTSDELDEFKGAVLEASLQLLGELGKVCNMLNWSQMIFIRVKFNSICFKPIGVIWLKNRLIN